MGDNLLLVGSVPFDTIEQVMRTFGGALGKHLPAMPDGKVRGCRGRSPFLPDLWAPSRMHARGVLRERCPTLRRLSMRRKAAGYPAASCAMGVAAMPAVGPAVATSPYDPEAVEALSNIVDEVWAEVSASFDPDPQTVETERQRLANIVLELARDPRFSSTEQIAQQAANRMLAVN